MNRTQFRWFLALGFLGSLLLRWLVPINPGFGATHDDELMVRMAANILRGEWVGRYSDFGHLLLSKPAGYPLFIARTHFFPWSPTVTVHFLIVLSILVCSVEFRIMGLSRGRVCGFFYLSSFFPVWYGSQMSRIYRDGFLVALTFLGIALTLRLGRLLPRFFSHTKVGIRETFQVALLSILTGLCLAWYAVTKPSWYPLAAVMLLLGARSLRLVHFVPLKRQLLRILVVFIAFSGGYYPLIGYIKSENRNHFGVYAIDTFSSGSFVSALQAWTSVQAGPSRRYVLLTKSQREAIYPLSSIADRLRPFLELPWGNGWRGSACSSPLSICDESAAWFPWDIRDAMRSAGLDTSATQFVNSFAQLNTEIRVACKKGFVKCEGGGILPGIRPLSEISKRELVDAYATSIDWLIFPNHEGLFRSGKLPQGYAFSADWKLAVRDLPLNQDPNKYRPETAMLGNSTSLLSRLVGLVWPILVAAALVQFLLSLQLVHKSQWTWIAAVNLLGLLAFIGQLALLESSSGMYLSAGKSLYLMPAIPFLLLFVVASLATVRSS